MSLTSPNRGWTLEEIEYDSGQLEGIHADLGKLTDAGGNAQIVLRNIDGGLEGRGQSITLVQRESGLLATRMNPTIATLGRIADVVRAYGEAVATHARNRERPDRRHRDRACGERGGGRRSRDMHDPSSRCAPPTTTRGTRSTAEQDVTDAQSSLATTRSALEGLWESWEAAYAPLGRGVWCSDRRTRPLGRLDPQRLDPLGDRRAGERRYPCRGSRRSGTVSPMRSAMRSVSRTRASSGTSKVRPTSIACSPTGRHMNE